MSNNIKEWNPEDPVFWESTGKKIAYRNLWISIPALLCGFAVWGMWGIITVQMLNLGFPFTQAELFTLTAIAGIAGATMRIPACCAMSTSSCCSAAPAPPSSAKPALRITALRTPLRAHSRSAAAAFAAGNAITAWSTRAPIAATDANAGRPWISACVGLTG